MKTAMEEANNLRGSNDRDQMIQGLAERKLANTKTSISFGNEKVRIELWIYLAIATISWSCKINFVVAVVIANTD